MFNPDNYFDIYSLLVDGIFGKIDYIVIIGMIAILFVCIKYNLSTAQTFILEAIFFLLIVSTNYGLWVTIVTFLTLVIGIIFYDAVSKAVNR
jgi:hypothetical protein